MQEIKSPERINDILLGPLERPTLRWLAAHMPAWVNPDILTATGVIGSAIIFSGYCLSNFHSNYIWLASLGFVINWFGDSLDGTLARYRNIQRPQYGFFVDHTMDAFSMVLIFIGLGFSPFVQFGLALLALTGYLLMSVLVYVQTISNGQFKLSYAKLGPTELRVVAIFANTLVYFSGNPSVDFGVLRLSLFDIVALGLGLALIGAFLFFSIYQANQLANIDQAPEDWAPGETKS